VSLDPAYLDYPRRAEGYDHDLYRWSNLFHRPPIAWPGGAAVAVWIVIAAEWFPLTPSDTPFRAPGHMATPYPDYRHYTARDYGTRVGLDRMLNGLDRVGAKASIAINGALAERHPALLGDVLARGHEVIAHSTDMNGTIASGVAEADERALIAASLAALAPAAPRGWLSVARSQSWNTPTLLAGAGLAYACDWVNDDLPYWQTTEAGPLAALPLNHELSDRQIVLTQGASAESYAEQIRDAYAWQSGEAARYGGGRMLPLHVTPYILGLPYRMAAFEGLLVWLADQPGAWFARGGDVYDAWSAQVAAAAPGP